MEPDIERKAPSEQSHPEQERRSGLEKPGKTPGSAEGGEYDKPPRSKPYPESPGKTPGRAEG